MSTGVSESREVIVIGSTGYLGSSLVPFLTRHGYRVLPAGRRLDDLVEVLVDGPDYCGFSDFISRRRPWCVVNLAAATNVDQCEADVVTAYSANAALPGVLSAVIARSSPETFFLHLSTDQVYPGVGDHPEEAFAPVNVYGLTKLVGELLVSAPRSAIIRTNFFGRSRTAARSDLSDWLIGSFRDRRRVTLFDDVIFNGLHVESLCSILEMVIRARLAGTFNVGSRGGVSKARFGLELAEILHLDTDIAEIGSVEGARLRARRPLNMTMNVSKIESALGIECPDVHLEIRRTAEEYLNVE